MNGPHCLQVRQNFYRLVCNANSLRRQLTILSAYCPSSQGVKQTANHHATAGVPGNGCALCYVRVAIHTKTHVEFHGLEKMDTLGFEPRAFRMRSGCDTTTPCAR